MCRPTNITYVVLVRIASEELHTFLEPAYSGGLQQPSLPVIIPLLIRMRV
jgi:hypothetical protein